MKRAGTAGFFALFFLLSLCHASYRVAVSTLEKPEGFNALLHQFENGKFSFQTEKGEKMEIPAAELVELRFETGAETAPQGKGAILLEFINGDRLTGRILEGGEDSIRFSPSSFEGLKIEIEILSRLLFLANASRFSSSLRWAPLQKNDTLYRITEKGWDHVKGIVTSLGEEKVSIDTDLGSFTFKYPQIIAIAIFQQSPYKEPQEILCTLRLKNGSSLTGTIQDFSQDLLSLEWLLGKRLRIPTDKIEALWFKNARYLFLSDLEPSRVEQTPYIGEEKDFLFPYQKDRTCTGNPLSVGGKRYHKGLGVHSRCRLTYALEGRFQGFSSLIGIDDEVQTIPAKGCVVFRVEVDGEVRYESPLVKGLSPALAVSLRDLKEAQALTLEVDFGDRSDAGDRADWIHVLLVK